MRRSTGIGLASAMAFAAVAGEPANNSGLLDQQNRASAQELRRMQQSNGPRSLFGGEGLRAPNTAQLQGQLIEQRALQARQRREYLGRHLRNKVVPTPVWRQRLGEIDQRRRFEMEQRRQLDLFRLRQRPYFAR